VFKLKENSGAKGLRTLQQDILYFNSWLCNPFNFSYLSRFRNQGEDSAGFRVLYLTKCS